MCYDQRSFGMKIRQLRSSKGMTQEELAEKANTERSHISKIEKGASSCSVNLLVVFANIFHVSTDYLLFDHKGNDERKIELLAVVAELAETIEKL